MHNDTEEVQTIAPQERIAQMIILPYVNIPIEEVEGLSDTDRGESGFGDSGRF